MYFYVIKYKKKYLTPTLDQTNGIDVNPSNATGPTMTLHVLCTEQPPPYYRVRKDDCMPPTIGYTWLDQNQLGLSPSTAMIRNTCLGNDNAK